MASGTTRIEVVTFDFGNTLVPVDRRTLQRVVERTACAVAGIAGLEVEAFLRFWAEEREHQFAEALPLRREVDLGERARRVLARLRGVRRPAPGEGWDEAILRRLVAAEEEAAVLEAYSAAFVALVPPRVEASAVLAALARRHRLGIVSNWPHAATIDRYLVARGWSGYLAAVVVSERVGAIKPDLAIFRAAEAALAVEPDERDRILHVGDDPLADVAGAKAAGWRAAHLRGRPDDSPLPLGLGGDGVAADVELASLADLPALLGS